MTAIICTALALAGGPNPCARGGAAIGPDRGGHALPLVGMLEGRPVTLVRRLPTFHAFVCIHGHEADWQDTGDPYWGGLQFDRSFMATYGRDMLQRHHGGLADTWTPAEQILVAHRAWETRGFGPWPNTRIPCGV